MSIKHLSKKEIELRKRSAIDLLNSTAKFDIDAGMEAEYLTDKAIEITLQDFGKMTMMKESSSEQESGRWQMKPLTDSSKVRKFDRALWRQKDRWTKLKNLLPVICPASPVEVAERLAKKHWGWLSWCPSLYA